MFNARNRLFVAALSVGGALYGAACGTSTLAPAPTIEAPDPDPVNDGSPALDPNDVAGEGEPVPPGGSDANDMPVVPMPIAGGGSDGGNTPAPTTPATYPPLPVLAPKVVATAKLTMAANPLVVEPELGSLSYEKSYVRAAYFRPDNANLVGIYNLLGPGIVRVGANAVDQVVWNGNSTNANVLSPAALASLGGFLRAAHWKALYGLRMVGSTPALAAEEAAVAKAKLGDALYAFEIGNEPDFYFRNARVAHGNYNVNSFLQGVDTVAGWPAYAAAIRARVPDAVLTGPGAYSATLTDWPKPFAAAQGNAIYELTQHYYKGWGPDASSTAASLLTQDATLANQIARLKSYAAPLGGRVRYTESNSFAGGGAVGASNAFASALWVSDYLFVAATQGLRGVHLHTGGGSNGNGYTAIVNDTNYRVTGTRPLLYGLLAFRRAAQGKLFTTAISPTTTKLSTYATQARDGSVRALVLNRSTTDVARVTLQWPSSVSVRRGTALVLRAQGPTVASQLASTGNVTLGGAAIGADGAWAPKEIYRVDIEDGKTSVDLPPITGVVVEVAQ